MRISKKYFPVIIFSLSISSAANTYSATITNNDVHSGRHEQQIKVGTNQSFESSIKETDFDARQLTYNLLSITNQDTGLANDYWGIEQFNDYALLSHKMMDAMVLSSTGYITEAQKILDYFATRLDISKDEVINKKDTNGIYGILKLVDDFETGEAVIGIVDGISTQDTSKSGRARSHYYVSPRSLSMMIASMLHSNPLKYHKTVLKIGDILLAFQDSKTGAIKDNDRMVNYTHSSEHIAAYSAFVMLSEVDSDPKWHKAAENAFFWFTSHSLDVSNNIIAQGYDKDNVNDTYTSSAYTQYFLSPAADKASISLIKNLTDRVIKDSLCNISLDLPNGEWIQVTMADEYNPLDPKVIEARGSAHPRGSFEETVYLILSLQKNAARLKNHDFNTARLYIAIADLLQSELKKTFFSVDQLRGLTSFSSTLQNEAYISLGANPTAMRFPVSSPYFYIQDSEAKGKSLTAATSISSMFNLILKGINPLYAGDNFAKINKAIMPRIEDRNKALNLLKYAVKGKIYSEETAKKSQIMESISEPEKYNAKMWEHFNLAEKYKMEDNTYKSRRNYEQALNWAFKTVNNTSWYMLAITDNKKKAQKYNGIIDYPQGLTFPNNESTFHTNIMRYPLLNEMGTAMWAIATINYELTNRSEAKRWIQKIIENIPLHQIPSTDGKLINGYWNALEAWEDNPNREVRDQKMHSLYMEVLDEMGLQTAKPKKIKI